MRVHPARARRGPVAVLAPAQAQNLDEGKSGARLFADTCVTCHHRAKGLTKGRIRVHAVFLPAAALRQQLQRGLGACLLSRIRRRGRPAASGGAGEKAVARNRARGRLASSTGGDPAAIAGRIVFAVFRLGFAGRGSTDSVGRDPARAFAWHSSSVSSVRSSASRARISPGRTSGGNWRPGSI